MKKVIDTKFSQGRKSLEIQPLLLGRQQFGQIFDFCMLRYDVISLGRKEWMMELLGMDASEEGWIF